MPRLHVLLLLLIGTILLAPACKTARNAGGPIRLKSKSTKFLLKKLASNRIEAEWISAKARITYKDDFQTKKFTANFRYRKDSLLWLNVKKASVEAARIQITPDSFFLIDRMNKQYVANSIDALEDRFEMPQRTAADQPIFDMMEELFLGNPLFFAGSELNSGIDGEEYTLKGTSEHFDSEYRIEGRDYLLTTMNFLPEDNRQYLKIDLDRSEIPDEYPNFPYFRTYKMHAPTQGDVTIKIKFTKLELDEPKNIRFAIPGSYTRID